MSAMLLLLLFFLGVLLSFIGGIIGVVDAFRVSTLWGVLALLVPFALLVFCIKFWRERKWARNSLIMSLLGLLAMVLPIPLGGGLAFLNARNDIEQEEEFCY
jgi:predicted branched-subunit amino acid permease